MYGNARFLRWLCGGLLVCACAGQAVGGTRRLVIHNVGSTTVNPLVRIWYDGSCSTWAADVGQLGTLVAGAWVTNYSSNAGSSAYNWSVRVCGTTDVCQGQYVLNGTSYAEVNECNVGPPPPATTNICSASVTLINTEGGPFAQHWVVDWVDASAQSPIRVWEGYIEPGGSTVVQAAWDYGSGHCPGGLSAMGDRIGYDAGTNIVSQSQDGTRPTTDAPEDGSGDTDVTDPGDPNTNSVTGGDLSKVIGELKKLAKESTLQETKVVLSGMAAVVTSINGQISTVNTKLEDIKGLLNGVAKEATQRETTNLLSQIRDWLSTNSAPSVGPTNWSDFKRQATNMFGGAAAESLALEGSISENPTNAGADFVTRAGPWASKMGNLAGPGATSGVFGTNSLPGYGSGIVGIDPDTSDDWFSWEQDSLSVGAMEFRPWTWKMTPGLPGGGAAASAFQAAFFLMKMVFVCGFTFLLWWDIQDDAQKRLRDMFYVPAASGTGGLTIAGFEAGFAVQVLIAAITVGIIYTAAAHLTGWLGASITNFAVGDVQAATWTDVKTAVETGNAGGFYSVWLPRVAMWVGKVFPFATAFGCISMWITYKVLRDATLRIAYAALKRAMVPLASRVLPIPAVFLIASMLVSGVSAATVVDGGSYGWITLSAPGVSNFVGIVVDGGVWPLQAAGSSGGPWQVPASISGVVVGSASNSVGDLGLISGSSLLVGSDASVVVSRPDTVHREKNLIRWASSGLVAGCVFGFVSLLGYVLKRGIRPAGAWGGGD